MLLHSHASSVEVSDGFESSSFTIVDSKNSFALLQGKQYEDPVNATLRALVENALDAHIDSGTTEKIKISVNQSETLVQDAGPGISPTTFEKHFTKFFASNRTHSNDYHGFFGVGAKAPLAVAKQFHVRTIHEGTEYTWICRRGDPAPTAELLESQPASAGRVGTTITLTHDSMDASFQDHRVWGRAAGKLEALMPATLVLEGIHSGHGYDARPMEPRLMIGGMPYPLPAKDALNLPQELYAPLNVTYPETVAVTPSHSGKNFGARKGSNKSTAVAMKSRQEALAVVFGIGDVELHFSKERVAATPSNLEKIRNTTMQTWLDWQLSLAQEFSVSEHASTITWRMPAVAAQELRKQGHPAELLAWASRPLRLDGPLDLLKETELSIIFRPPAKAALSTAKKWVATIATELERTAIETWANDWGIGVHWVQSTKNNMAVIHAQALASDRLVTYDENVETIGADLPTSPSPVVVTMNEQWTALDPTMKSAISQWLMLNQTRTVVATSLTLADVQQHLPQCIGLKEHCAQVLQAFLAAIPEDALGMKTAMFSDPRYTPEEWVSRRWAGPYTGASQHLIDSIIETYKAMHTWLEIPAIDYVNVDAWAAKQKEKMPLLGLLSPKFSEEHLQHLNELLSHS